MKFPSATQSISPLLARKEYPPGVKPAAFLVSESGPTWFRFRTKYVCVGTCRRLAEVVTLLLTKIKPFCRFLHLASWRLLLDVAKRCAIGQLQRVDNARVLRSQLEGLDPSMKPLKVRDVDIQVCPCQPTPRVDLSVTWLGLTQHAYRECCGSLAVAE